MKCRILLVLVLAALMIPSAWATFSVHDSVAYIHETIKAIQDELYQQMDLDYQVDQLGKTGEILKTSVDTLKVTRDTYNTTMDIYNSATDIASYIGDPMRLLSYMNSRFWHENEIKAALNITREALDMADSKVCSTGNIDYLLHQMEYGLRDVEVRKSEDLAETQKGALAVHEFMSEWGPKAWTQLTELNREDQQYNARNSNMTEMQYATYKNGIWQSNALGQMFAAQTAHSAMVAQQMYMENSRLDEEDYRRAKAIYDNRQCAEAGAEVRKSQGSISGSFIDTFVGN